MRWSEYRAGLTPEGFAHVVNLLTVGSGSIVFAVRLSGQDAPATQVLHYLANAHDALRLAERTVSAVLAPLLNGVSSVKWGDVPEADLPWSALMSRLPPGKHEYLIRCMGTAARSARQASEVVLADGEVDEVRRQLQSAVDALAEARFVVPTLAAR
jgi:hypothetical protein